jgi:hypothetical protein
MKRVVITRRIADYRKNVKADSEHMAGPSATIVVIGILTFGLKSMSAEGQLRFPLVAGVPENRS